MRKLHRNHNLTKDFLSRIFTFATATICHVATFDPFIWLVVSQPLWKIWVRQWEGWHPIYEMENFSHVPKHQPVIEWKQLLQFHQVILREVQHFQVALRCCRAPGQGLEPIAGLAIPRWAEMVPCLVTQSTRPGKLSHNYGTSPFVYGKIQL